MASYKFLGSNLEIKGTFIVKHEHNLGRLASLEERSEDKSQ